MGLFNRNPYMGGMGVPPRTGGIKVFLLILGVALGLYFLNLTFLWIKIPALPVAMVKPFNAITGILLIILGIMSVVRPRY
jgi:hypothetical protein